MILASPTAPPGSVKHISTWTAADIPPGSAVLCRNNAPLIATAFALLSADHSCYILGKDIAAQLITQLKKFPNGSIEELRSAVLRWRNSEVDKFERANRPSKVAATQDRAACLILFINKAPNGPSSVEGLINKLFSATANGTVLSTIHKAKGMEWTTVFLLDSFLIGKFAKNDWQKEQEVNLHYVAATRAKVDLVYINADDME